MKQNSHLFTLKKESYSKYFWNEAKFIKRTYTDGHPCEQEVHSTVLNIHL